MDEKANLVELMRDIAKELGSDTVSRPEFLRRSKVSERRIQVLFGSYNGLVEAAGLTPQAFPSSDSPMYSDEELLEEVTRVLRLPGSKMTRVFFEQNASISTSVCERRFGGWINTIRTAAEQLDPQADASLLGRISEYTKPHLPSPRRAVGDPGSDEDEQPIEPGPVAQRPIGHQMVAGGVPNLYGDFLNFRGLQHAPVNEQGVVFLFGMICHELGYMVEIVKTGFPDCEAKRKVRGKPGMWQRVRIEFEFQSRNFYKHGHDPDQCDVVICWEDNWPDCPLEVLELRSALQSLEATGGRIG